MTQFQLTALDPGRWKRAGGVELDDVRVDVRYVDGTVVLAVRGEIDMATAQALEAPLDDLKPTVRAVIDLSDVEFMDSTALRAIFVKALMMNDVGGSLHIRNASAQVRQLLHVTEFEVLLEKNAAT